MIGQVRFDIHGERTATLNDDRTWTIEPALDEGRQSILMGYLKLLSDDYEGPQDGFFGPSQLHNAAKFLNGTVTSEPEIPAGDEDLIY